MGVTRNNRERPPARPRWVLRLMWKIHRWGWRVSGGRLGATTLGMPVVELTTTGRRSGEPRSILITTLEHEDGWIVAGTNAGHDRDPAWVHNLRADPEALVFNRRGRHVVHADFLEGAAHETAWAEFVAADDDYSNYERMLERPVPIVLLRRT